MQDNAVFRHWLNSSAGIQINGSIQNSAPKFISVRTYICTAPCQPNPQRCLAPVNHAAKIGRKSGSPEDGKSEKSVRLNVCKIGEAGKLKSFPASPFQETTANHNVLLALR